MLCVRRNIIVVSRERWTPAIQFKKNVLVMIRTGALAICLKNRSSSPPT